VELPSQLRHLSDAELRLLDRLRQFRQDGHIGPTFEGFLALVWQIVRRASKPPDGAWHIKRVFEPLMPRTAMQRILTELVSEADIYPPPDAASLLDPSVHDTVDKLTREFGKREAYLGVEADTALFSTLALWLMGEAVRPYLTWVDRISYLAGYGSSWNTEFIGQFLEPTPISDGLASGTSFGSFSTGNQTSSGEIPIFEFRNFGPVYVHATMWSDWARDMWRWLRDGTVYDSTESENVSRGSKRPIGEVYGEIEP
jgi:hypothetical protein